MRLAVPTALLTTLLLAACGAREEAAPAAAGEAPAAVADEAAIAEAPMPPLPSGDFRIASVTLGKAVDAEGQVAEAVEVFAPGDTVHAAVVGVGTSGGLTLSARWLAADGTEIAKAGQALVPTAPTVATFTLSQPEPWPAGEYVLEVAINERVAETRRFRVE